MTTKSLVIVLAAAAAGLSSLNAQVTVAADDFEGAGILSGGTGFSGNWAVTGPGGTFANTGSPIGGSQSLGIFSNGGLTTISRSFATPVATIGQELTIDVALQPLYDVVALSGSEFGINLISDAGVYLTFKFNTGNTSLVANDGGADFTLGGITFTEDAVYDFSITTIVGSNAYEYTVDERGSSESSFSASPFTANNPLPNSFTGVEIFMNAPSGAGNDLIVDDFEGVVPEPAAASAVAGLLTLALIARRR